MAPTWQALIDGSMYVDERLREIFDDLRPDVVVQDNVVCFPAVVTGPHAWVRIVSCNPLEMPDADLPPAYSGLPAGDRSGWEAFRSEYRRTHRPMWEAFDAFVRERGAPGLPELGFIQTSPHLNLYVYPAEADYRRARSLEGPWRRLDSSVRATDDPFDPPEGFEPGRDGAGRLLYLSLGSLGSADVALMQRLIGHLADSPYRVIVSKGPQAGEISLPPNMWGLEFLPQTRVIPQVDLVITHGGNNTVTESFHAGKPMVVLPLFWDQHDNAQRVDELGFGVRLDPYRCSREDLIAAIERLLADRALAARLDGIARRLQAEPGTVQAADLIERTAADRLAARG
jgi:MGT family glycosyltransferase